MSGCKYGGIRGVLISPSFFSPPPKAVYRVYVRGRRASTKLTQKERKRAAVLARELAEERVRTSQLQGRLRTGRKKSRRKTGGF